MQYNFNKINDDLKEVHDHLDEIQEEVEEDEESGHSLALVMYCLFLFVVIATMVSIVLCCKIQKLKSQLEGSQSTHRRVPRQSDAHDSHQETLPDVS